jgi:hypothetical protein
LPHIECAEIENSHLIQYKLTKYFSLVVGCIDFSQHFDLKCDLAIKLLFMDLCKWLLLLKCVFVIQCYCTCPAKLELVLFDNHVTSCDWFWWIGMRHHGWWVGFSSLQLLSRSLSALHFIMYRWPISCLIEWEVTKIWRSQGRAS